MKSSTEALFLNAMKTNVDIQDDNLIMLEQCNKLCYTARILNSLKKIASSVEEFDNVTVKLLDIAIDFSNRVGFDKTKYNTLSSADKKAYSTNLINNYIDSSKKEIGCSLINMLEASMKDFDTPIVFNDKINMKYHKKLVTYSHKAVENITDAINDILQHISFTNAMDQSYEHLLRYFAKGCEVNMAMINTSISQEGFVSIDIPQPKYQTLDEAEITNVNDIIEMTNSLNHITYKEMRERLNNIKLNLTDKLNNAEDIEDIVKSHHLLAQMIMSLKNSTILMKNYHQAAINEISDEGYLYTNYKNNSLEHHQVANRLLRAKDIISKFSKSEWDRLANKILRNPGQPADTLDKALDLLIPFYQDLGEIDLPRDLEIIPAHYYRDLHTLAQTHAGAMATVKVMMKRELFHMKNTSASRMGYTKQSFCETIDKVNRILYSCTLQQIDQLIEDDWAVWAKATDVAQPFIVCLKPLMLEICDSII